MSPLEKPKKIDMVPGEYYAVVYCKRKEIVARDLEFLSASMNGGEMEYRFHDYRRNQTLIYNFNSYYFIAEPKI